MKELLMYAAGDAALTVNFGNRIDLATHNSVYQLYQTLFENPNPLWVDIIPAYTSLTIIYDVAQVRKHHPSAFDWVKSQVQNLVDKCDWEKEFPSRKVQIPVCYDLEFALDSKSLISQKKISLEKLIELHSQPEYQIYMIGFLPGFAYMGSIHKKIATPRLKKPRMLVPEGSVGIAGEQTGIYPIESPGGWNIIGRTPLKIFDPALPSSSQVLLKPGDRVKFYPITLAEYKSFDQSTFELVIG